MPADVLFFPRALKLKLPGNRRSATEARSSSFFPAAAPGPAPTLRAIPLKGSQERQHDLPKGDRQLRRWQKGPHTSPGPCPVVKPKMSGLAMRAFHFTVHVILRSPCMSAGERQPKMKAFEVGALRPAFDVLQPPAPQPPAPNHGGRGALTFDTVAASKTPACASSSQRTTRRKAELQLAFTYGI